ncbi:MAG: dihydropteroate synthase, partial [Hyphomicrobiales bacterium]
AKKFVERAGDSGIAPSDVVVDPLVMPVGALNNAGVQAMELIRKLRGELKVNTICGASNVSFGLPNRHAMNAHFLSMAIGAGMTSAILNPLHRAEMDGVNAANVLAGHDPDCRSWLAANRAPGEAATALSGRRGGRRGRTAA